MNLNIYIVEDDKNACNAFYIAAKSMDDIIITGHTDNSFDAYNYITENNPDAIILDLELRAGNGPDLLTQINELSPNNRPFVIITTNNTNPVVMDYLHQNQSGYIYNKYESSYSEFEVLNLLRLLKTSIYNYRNSTNTGVYREQEDTKAKILSDIDSELIRIGIKPKVSGYKYIQYAIYYVMKDSYSPNILRLLSNTFNVEPKNIEHNVRYAIQSAWSKYKSVDDIRKIYPGHVSDDMDVPSFGDFITHYAEMLKPKYINYFEKIN